LQTISRNGGRIVLNQNGGSIALPDSSATNEIQTLSKTGNTISLSNGGGSVVVTDKDTQQLSISAGKGKITLSNGGSIVLADSSATNEIQTLSQSGNTISLSNGGGSVTVGSGSNSMKYTASSFVFNTTNKTSYFNFDTIFFTPSASNYSEIIHTITKNVFSSSSTCIKYGYKLSIVDSSNFSAIQVLKISDNKPNEITSTIEHIISREPSYNAHDRFLINPTNKKIGIIIAIYIFNSCGTNYAGWPSSFNTDLYSDWVIIK
jgi:hypothetical protein